MAAVIPEAAEAVSSGSAAVEGASARAGSREIKPSAIPARNRPPFGPEPRRAGGQAGGTRKGEEGSARAQSRRKSGNRSRAYQGSKKAGRGALKARPSGSHTYQPVILAEFVVAIVIVSVSPVAKGGTAESVAKGSPSPYSVNTLKQLVAIGGAYFILALLASSRRAGRYAAWFGGLILLGLGFTQLANGDLTALFKVFGPSSGAAAPSDILGTSVTPGSTPADIQNAAQNALNPTAIFPTVEPGGTVVPAISLQDSGAGQTTSITAPAGGSAVVTSGPGPNLA